MVEHRTTRIGLIGCGFYAQNHLHAWDDLKSQNAELVAVCDQDPIKAEAAGKRFGAFRKLPFRRKGRMQRR